ncbi:hypothetical protein BN946_scf184707.g5 [Trametes cinnabarina]|uniref:BTB domain-containing protein n=1 Tax=Pycnoporus cinnabarinus TaxID=5643 RepID=A0A060S829_PYCCI|nr:hypothetical protein BN946_scf184707.g5 [Trametes cinnabarina]
MHIDDSESAPSMPDGKDVVPEPSTTITLKRSAADPIESQDDATASKRAKVTSAELPPKTNTKAPEPPYQQSDEFWYPDGNIVIIVNETGFRLFLSRLRQYCKFFEREILETAQNASLPAPENGEDASQVDKDLESEGAPNRLYTLQEGPGPLAAMDFMIFLRALETPLQYAASSQSPDQTSCISLLKVAKKVECDAVLNFATDHLRAMWPLTTPPSTQDRDKTLPEANAILDIARTYQVSGVSRRAFYEFLRRQNLWTKPLFRRRLSSLSESDILSIFRARLDLQRKWTGLLFTPPGAEGRCLAIGRGTKKCQWSDEDARERNWRADFVTQSLLEMGLGNPFYHLQNTLEGDAFKSLERSWCAACIEERKSAWAAARLSWWDSLGEIFDLKFPDS